MAFTTSPFSIYLGIYFILEPEDTTVSNKVLRLLAYCDITLLPIDSFTFYETYVDLNFISFNGAIKILPC